jgi:predicted PhzF superfamily epimerase YddE/YHI9
MLAGTDSTEFVLHQGDDMGRPSVLHLRVQQGEGLNPKVQVGGSCQPMINGILQLDR